MDDVGWMQHAIQLAECAEQEGEVPVGAVLIKDGEMIGEGWNRPIASHDPTAHAEIQALRNASTRLANYRLPDTTLFVTLEPCAMCAGAIILARVSRVVYATTDPRGGAVESVFNVLNEPRLNHLVETTSGVLAEQAATQLRQFFAARR